MLEIVVVNMRHCKDTDIVYVGRPMPGRPGSPLGNPYKLQKGEDPQPVVEKYRRWLWTQMSDPASAQSQELRRIANMQGVVKLACWCHPAPCHADVVKAAVEWIIKSEKEERSGSD